MFALAQHYGIPTRLLDWSIRPFVATYFPTVKLAQARIEGKPVPERFAIWALSRRYIATVAVHWSPGITIVSAPSVSNPNLRAQAALFTLVRWKMSRADQRYEIPPLEKVLADSAEIPVPDQDEAFRVHPALVKFTIPTREANTLLWRLAQLGVTAATIFPGHKGAADALYERVWWQIGAEPHERA